MIPEPHILMDTTLRDGEQSPHVRFTPAEKARYVELAELAGLRYIEVGFPLNKYDHAACKAAAQASKLSRLVGLGITTRDSVDACAQVGVHEIVFIVPSSSSHLESLTGQSISELVRNMIKAAQYAIERSLIPTVGFEDASQGDTEIIHYILAAMKESAIPFGCVRIGDTRGQLTPLECSKLSDIFFDNRPTEKCRIAFHAHNDLGLATANAFASLTSAKPVDCAHVTALGLGERAGNASLEQLGTLIERKMGKATGFSWSAIGELVDFVSMAAFILPLPYQPVIGARVFTHEAGLHQKAVLSDPSNYEFLEASHYGRKSELVLGKHSGRAFKSYLANQMNRPISDIDDYLDSLMEIDKADLYNRYKFIRDIYNSEFRLARLPSEIEF